MVLSVSKSSEQLLVLDCIFSKSALKLIPHFPLDKNKPISIQELSKLSGVPLTTAYRVIKKLSKWDNLVVTEFYIAALGAPLFLYHLKTKHLLVKIGKKEITIKQLVLRGENNNPR